jgi:hypothetical protein
MAQLGALQNTSDILGVNEPDIAINRAIPGFSVPSVPACFRAIWALSARIWAQSGRMVPFRNTQHHLRTKSEHAF